MSGRPAAESVAADADAVCLTLGPYTARIGSCKTLRQTALDLRQLAFSRDGHTDTDAFDDDSLHGVVSQQASGLPCVAFRARLFDGTVDLGDSYTAQDYDLRPLAALSGPVLELGRLCQSAQTHPGALRATWAALTALADRHHLSLMIGCSSFRGADPHRHLPALATLRARHLGPSSLRPGKGSPRAFDLPGPETTPGPLPPLLRSYLGMGGWVSDHAVSDPLLDTVHVFTGLRVADIPDQRKERLRALVRGAVQPQTLDVARAAP